jgi:hypothetical protein
MKLNQFFFLFLIFYFLISGWNTTCSHADNPEQTYIHSSQPYYLTGNTLHYVVYLFDNKLGHREVPSSILVVELFDQEGKVIFDRFHSMKEGCSPGTFLIPDTLTTGCYWLRAYTRYQVGYTENLIHYLPVWIFNKDDVINPSWIQEKLNYPSGYSENNNNEFKNPKVRDTPNGNSITIEIFPGNENPSIREKLNINVKITGPDNEPVTTFFSVLIRDRKQFGSDLHRFHNLPFYRTVQNSAIPYSAPQRNQLVRKDLDSKGSANEIRGKARYEPQKELILHGRYVDPVSQQGLAFRAISLTQTGKNPGFELIFTDRGGNFVFNQLNFNNLENRLVLNENALI